jgi:hypothetical protein
MARTSPPPRRRQVTTALKVLALLQHRAPIALSSHGMGLQIQDPDKPLSVVLKTLSRDGYIRAVGQRGARTVLWGLTDVGQRSLQRRADLAAEATRWLEDNPSYRDIEQPVLMALSHDQWRTPFAIADNTGFRVVAIRQAMTRLHERGLIAIDDTADAARLNTHGQYEASRIRVRLWQQDQREDG